MARVDTIIMVVPIVGLATEQDWKMITVQILEANDKVRSDDWCRPLQIVSMSGGHSDYYSFECQYTGRPENNAKWVHVSDVFGECWIGHTVREICTDRTQYEFARGAIPINHQYGKTKRQRREDYNTYKNTTISFGKYKGKYTLSQIESMDPRYYDWAFRTGLIKSVDDFNE